jgi:peroxiredoxin
VKFKAICIFIPTLTGLALLGGACSTDPVEPARNIKPLDAPDFQLPDLKGVQVSSDSLKGKSTIITFWTTWAPSAVHQLHDLQQLELQYQEAPVQIVAISLEEAGVKDLEVFLQHSTYPFPILRAHPDFHQQFGGIDAVPSTFVIDPQWKIINRYTGRTSLSELTKELDWLLRPEE